MRSAANRSVEPLRRARRAPVNPVNTGGKHANDHHLSLVEQLGTSGVLAVVMGLVVLGGYGDLRNVVPVFDGDEWLPQLVSIALFCSLLVAFLSVLPWLDLMLVPTFSGKSAPDQKQIISPGTRYLLVHAAAGLVLLGCVAWITNPAARGLAFLGIVVVGALFAVEWELVWGRSTAPQQDNAPVVIGCLAVAGMVVQLILVLMVSAVMNKRLPVAAGIQEWLPAIAVVMVMVVCRWAFLAVLRGAQLKLKVIGAAVPILVIGFLFSPEIVRMAGLGNLPNARLVLEGDAACEVARHLRLVEADAGCALSKVPEQLALHVDIVSRVGGFYVLAAHGDLDRMRDGKCQFTHAGSVDRPLSKDPASFRCADVPRDAVKLILR